MENSAFDAVFGDGEQPVVETPAPEIAQEPAQAPEPSQDVPRDESGRFAPKTAETPPAGDPEAPVSEPGDAEKPLTKRELDGVLKATLSERDRRQAAERERDELRAKLEAATPKSDAPANAADQQRAALEYETNLKLSRRFAERDHGKELVQTIHDWAAAKCDIDPEFNAAMRASDDPYGDAKAAYDAILAKVNQPSGAQQTQPPAAETPLPRSLVNEPGNGSPGQPALPPSGFDAVFNS